MIRITIVVLDDDGPCEYCGKVAELRPYGKDGAKICYTCGHLPENIETTNAEYTKAMLKPTKDQLS